MRRSVAGEAQREELRDGHSLNIINVLSRSGVSESASFSLPHLSRTVDGRRQPAAMARRQIPMIRHRPTPEQMPAKNLTTFMSQQHLGNSLPRDYSENALFTDISSIFAKEQIDLLAKLEFSEKR